MVPAHDGNARGVQVQTISDQENAPLSALDAEGIFGCKHAVADTGTDTLGLGEGGITAHVEHGLQEHERRVWPRFSQMCMPHHAAWSLEGAARGASFNTRWDAKLKQYDLASQQKRSPPPVGRCAAG